MILQHLFQNLGIAGWDVRAVSGSDASGPVDKQHRKHGGIPLRFNWETVIIAVLQDIKVLDRQQLANARLEIGVDIPRRRRILSTLNAGSELSLWDEP